MTLVLYTMVIQQHIFYANQSAYSEVAKGKAEASYFVHT